MFVNKRDLKRLESEFKLNQQTLSTFTKDNFDQRIKELWKEMKIQMGKENLKKMPIDTITTLEKGMPINVLVNHGFRNIYDIKDEDPFDLMQLDEIGEKSAYRICEAVTKIRESVYEQAKPIINPDDLRDQDIDLLEVIYTKWKLLEKIHVLTVNYEKLNEVLSPLIETAKEKRGFIGSLFQSKATKNK